MSTERTEAPEGPAAQGQAHPIASIATWIVAHEGWLLLLAGPPLVLPEFLRGAAWGGVGLLLLIAGSHVLLRRPPLVPWWVWGSVFILTFMAMIGYVISSDPVLSWPKLTSILYSLAVLVIVGGGPSDTRRFWTLGGLLVAVGFGIATLGLVGTEWQPGKVALLIPIYDALPRLVHDIPRSTAGGFHANEVGGALAMALPVAVGFLLTGPPTLSHILSGPSTLPGSFRRLVNHWAIPIIFSTMSILLMAGVLVLTQSRGAWLGLAAGILAAWSRRARWGTFLVGGTIAMIVLVTAMVVFVSLSGVGLGAILIQVDALARLGDGGTSGSGMARAEMWRNALLAWSDYPLTGLGLNTFPLVTRADYIYMRTPPSFNMAHAHNIYLQVGSDLGILGLVAFLLLAGGILTIWWCTTGRLRGKPGEALLLGCGSGLTASLVHGFMDATARPLGSKPGILFWGIAAIVLLAYRQQSPGVVMMPSSRAIRMFIGAGCLVLVALTVPLRPAIQRNVGAVLLDQARLRPGLTVEERRHGLMQAIDWLRAGQSSYGDRTSVRLGIAYAALGRRAEALQVWRLSPSALDFLLSQGVAAHRRGDVRESAYWFSLAQDLAPGNGRVLYYVGRSALERGDQASAADALTRALALDSFREEHDEYRDALVQWGYALLGLGQAEEAIRAFQAAIAQGAGARAEVGRIRATLQMGGNRGTAEAELRAAIARSPDLLLMMELVQMLYADGKLNEAAQAAQQMSSAFPANADAQILAASVAMGQGRYSDAQRLYRIALRLKPDDAKARLGLAQALLADGQTKEGVRLLKEIVHQDSRNIAALLALAGGLERLGNLDEAIATYRQVLSIQPSNTAAWAALSALGVAP